MWHFVVALPFFLCFSLFTSDVYFISSIGNAAQIHGKVKCNFQTQVKQKTPKHNLSTLLTLNQIESFSIQFKFLAFIFKN